MTCFFGTSRSHNRIEASRSGVAWLTSLSSGSGTFTSLPGMSARIQRKRAAGMKVTTPLFTGGDTFKRVAESFTLCGSGCQDPSSPQYILKEQRLID